MRTRVALWSLGLGLASLVACGRADVEDWSDWPEGEGPPGAGSGAGAGAGAGAGTGAGAGAGSGGAGGAGAGSGAGGAGAGSGAGGAGAGSGSGGAGAGSGAGGAGGGVVCPSYGDTCTGCLSNSCPDVWCSCYENPDCVPLITCANGCNGDEGCVQGCMTTYEGGIADVYLVTDCAGDVCDQACGGGGNDVDACTVCLASDCEDELNACLGDPDCLDLYGCLDSCPSVDLSCQQDCYDTYGAGVPALEGLLQCAQSECGGPC